MIEAPRDMRERVLDGCRERSRSAIHERRSPMQDGIVGMLVRVGADLQVEP